VSAALALLALASLMTIRAWADVPCKEQCKHYVECLRQAGKASRISANLTDGNKFQILQERCRAQYQHCLGSCGPLSQY
jgi:hypothetical protein